VQDQIHDAKVESPLRAAAPRLPLPWWHLVGRMRPPARLVPDCAAACGEAPWYRGAARERPRVPGDALLRLPFLKGNAMSNKAHLRPHKRPQQGSRNRAAALLLALLFVALVALAVVMVSSGHVIPAGVR
jgi:hypothetical protein